MHTGSFCPQRQFQFLLNTSLYVAIYTVSVPPQHKCVCSYTASVPPEHKSACSFAASVPEHKPTGQCVHSFNSSLNTYIVHIFM